MSTNQFKRIKVVYKVIHIFLECILTGICINICVHILDSWNIRSYISPWGCYLIVIAARHFVCMHDNPFSMKCELVNIDYRMEKNIFVALSFFILFLCLIKPLCMNMWYVTQTRLWSECIWTPWRIWIYVYLIELLILGLVIW